MQGVDFALQARHLALCGDELGLLGGHGSGSTVVGNVGRACLPPDTVQRVARNQRLSPRPLQLFLRYRQLVTGIAEVPPLCCQLFLQIHGRLRRLRGSIVGPLGSRFRGLRLPPRV